jgi:hypothetical protein
MTVKLEAAPMTTKAISGTECAKLRITFVKGNNERITLSHLDSDNKVISTAITDPEEAYEYANAILAAVDEVWGIT